MNKTIAASTVSPDLMPLSIAEQANIKGGKGSSCEEKRRTIRRPR
jgi:hypothetical protein